MVNYELELGKLNQEIHVLEGKVNRLFEHKKELKRKVNATKLGLRGVTGANPGSKKRFDELKGQETKLNSLLAELKKEHTLLLNLKKKADIYYNVILEKEGREIEKRKNAPKSEYDPMAIKMAMIRDASESNKKSMEKAREESAKKAAANKIRREQDILNAKIRHELPTFRNMMKNADKEFAKLKKEADNIQKKTDALMKAKAAKPKAAKPKAAKPKAAKPKAAKPKAAKPKALAKIVKEQKVLNARVKEDIAKAKKEIEDSNREFDKLKKQADRLMNVKIVYKAGPIAKPKAVTKPKKSTKKVKSSKKALSKKSQLEKDIRRLRREVGKIEKNKKPKTEETAEEKQKRKQILKKLRSELYNKNQELREIEESKQENVIQGPKGGKRAKKYNIANLAKLIADGNETKFYEIEESAQSEIDNILSNFDKIEILKKNYEEFKQKYKVPNLNNQYIYNGANMKDSTVRDMFAMNYYFNGGTNV